ncbi:MAG: hypothetical protein SF069_06970 [Phycisphaerae bacterium]|nr:hypothetical protein [Phycisphaerae bacterium]
MPTRHAAPHYSQRNALMLRRLWYYLFDWSFYLPGVAAEMRGMSRAQQNSARLFVWRRLFRSVHYWLLTAAVVLLVMPVGLFALRWSISSLALSAGANFELRVVYVSVASLAGIVATLGIAVLSMQPLRAMVRSAFDDYLRSAGLRLCRQCGYDLRETPVPRCPECGGAMAAANTAPER